ncbi:unnamed protein product [Closterium sp. Naga37s-1]|nr:unnamed protein product [Closterium sp. Naga37s-1]
MAIDLKAGGRNKKTHRTAPKSRNPYLLLLVKIYRFLARRTGSPFNKVVLRRLFMSRTNRPPVALSRVLEYGENKGAEAVVTVVGKVTDDKRLYAVREGVKVCALAFSATARARIEKAGGECLSFDQLALQRPTGNNCLLLRGKVTSREAFKHFGPAPGVPHSNTRPYVRSQGRKREMARGRRNSRGFKTASHRRGSSAAPNLAPRNRLVEFASVHLGRPSASHAARPQSSASGAPLTRSACVPRAMGGTNDLTASDAAKGQESRQRTRTRRFAILLAGHSRCLESRDPRIRLEPFFTGLCSQCTWRCVPPLVHAARHAVGIELHRSRRHVTFLPRRPQCLALFPPCLPRLSSVSPPSLLRLSSVSPPSLLHLSSVPPPTRPQPRGSPYSQQRYGDYSGMFLSLLRDGGHAQGEKAAGEGEAGERWDVFSVVDGQFPSAQDLEEVEAVVVTGSKHDAHADDPWILQLCALLQQLHRRHTKILGVCFGHQVVGRALGGRTGRAAAGWELGIKPVHCTADVASLPYAAGLPSSFKILEIHQDQVLELPPEAVLLGSSPRTPIEMFAIGEHVVHAGTPRVH